MEDGRQFGASVLGENPLTAETAIKLGFSSQHAGDPPASASLALGWQIRTAALGKCFTRVQGNQSKSSCVQGNLMDYTVFP